MSTTATQLLSSGEFCKLRYDTILAKSASSNVSVYILSTMHGKTPVKITCNRSSYPFAKNLSFLPVTMPLYKIFF